jgi:hypothetical protein
MGTAVQYLARNPVTGEWGYQRGDNVKGLLQGANDAFRSYDPSKMGHFVGSVAPTIYLGGKAGVQAVKSGTGALRASSSGGARAGASAADDALNAAKSANTQADDALNAAKGSPQSPNSRGPSNPALNPGQSPAVVKGICKDCPQAGIAIELGGGPRSQLGLLNFDPLARGVGGVIASAEALPLASSSVGDIYVIFPKGYKPGAEIVRVQKPGGRTYLAAQRWPDGNFRSAGARDTFNVLSRDCNYKLVGEVPFNEAFPGYIARTTDGSTPFATRNVKVFVFERVQ